MDARDRAALLPDTPFEAEFNPKTEEISWWDDNEVQRALPWFGTVHPPRPEWYQVGNVRRANCPAEYIERAEASGWHLLCSRTFGWVEHRVERTVKTTREICYLCNGDGKHVNPSIDSNGITGEEMAELGEDFREEYFSGVYDVVCYACKGRNWTHVVDPDNSDPAGIEAWYRWQEDESNYRAEVEAERRAGC